MQTTNNLRQRCLEALSPPTTSTKTLVETLESRLPDALLEELVQWRSKLRMKEALTRRGLDFEAMCEFLKAVDGRMFGSCPLACVLEQDWFEDVDVLLPEVGNHVVRGWAKRIFPDQETRENYCPRHVCSHAAEANGDPELFTYHREHRTARATLDITQAKDADGLFDCKLLDTDSLVFDGECFRWKGNRLVRLVRSPECRIVKTGSGMAFEHVYDFWCFYCLMNRPETQPELADWHLTVDYVERMDLDHNRPERLVGVPKLHRHVVDSFAETEGLAAKCLPGWISFEDLADVKRLRDAVVPRFRELNLRPGEEPLSEYLVVKLFLRLVKHALRGVRCVNFDECFDPALPSHPERFRSPFKFPIQPKCVPKNVVPT